MNRESVRIKQVPRYTTGLRVVLASSLPSGRSNRYRRDEPSAIARRRTRAWPARSAVRSKNFTRG
ncbi:MAG TPA: hypothetical protein PLO90_05130 [Clostridia bacterium]|jgi:hypothetical protein|nr:hypothetical protein [Clostridia bacterium]HPY43731.1 hypothetical protein [Clostridia bacterium]HQA98158.1 hypothetical protein [Clostridia bacterium]HQO56457.1 hypothetical protein [Clostridia bacterium]HUM60814.1 hypothetical protein [Clostridia bacterium]